MRNLSVSAVLKRLIRNSEARTSERIRALNLLSEHGVSRRFLEQIIKGSYPPQLTGRASFLLIEKHPVEPELSLKKPTPEAFLGQERVLGLEPVPTPENPFPNLPYELDPELYDILCINGEVPGHVRGTYTSEPPKEPEP
jgi:hypothetical protein